MSEENIDGHVQHSGDGYHFYLTKQPGLSCETSDHSTCKRKSAELMANRTAAEKAEHERIVADSKAQVQKSAEAAAVSEQQEMLNEAGRRKHEALRVAGIKANDKIEAAQKNALEAITLCNKSRDTAVDKANVDLEKAISRAREEQKKMQDEVEATDWLSDVKKNPEGKTRAKLFPWW